MNSVCRYNSSVCVVVYVVVVALFFLFFFMFFFFLIFAGNKFSLFSSLQGTLFNLYLFTLFCYIRNNVSFRLGGGA
jgi:apolipoprotein N-acyltransferase